MQFKFNKIALTCAGVFILANTIVSCKFGGEVGGRADDGSAVQAQQPDTLHNFMDTLNLHHEHAFTLNPKVKNVLNVTFAWSEDPDCERVDYSTPISGKLAVDNTQTNTYLLSPEAYEFLNTQSGGYKGQKIRDVFKSYRIYMDVEDQAGEKTTELGQCYKIGQSLAAASSTEPAFTWPINDPCTTKELGFTPAAKLPGMQWHNSGSFATCSSQFAITGLMESGFVKRLNSYQVPHGASLYCSCNYISWDGETLTACCDDGGGKWKSASLEYKNCKDGQAVENVKGQLLCAEPLMPNYTPQIHISRYTMINSPADTAPDDVQCTFRSPDEATNDLSYTCTYGRLKTESQHFNAELCDDLNQLYWPIYGPQAGHLACKSTNKIIPNSTTDEYLKVLLQQSDTFIHCNTYGICYLDFYGITKPYTSMEFANAGALAKYVSDSQPMNADGEVIDKDHSANALYWGQEKSYMGLGSFTEKTLDNTRACVIRREPRPLAHTQLWLDQPNINGSHTRLVKCGDSEKDCTVKTGTDGDLCAFDSNTKKDCASSNPHDEKEYIPALNLHSYQVLKLERSKVRIKGFVSPPLCSVVSIRGTKRYQFTLANGSEASWNDYTSAMDDAMNKAKITQYIGSTSVSVLGMDADNKLKAAVFDTSWTHDSIRNDAALLEMIQHNINIEGRSTDAILYNSDQFYSFLKTAPNLPTSKLTCTNEYPELYWPDIPSMCKEKKMWICAQKLPDGKFNMLPGNYRCGDATK